MSDSKTIARPYAKALFEHALAENKLSDWSEILLLLAEVTASQQVVSFISNPESTEEQQIELLMAVVNKLDHKEEKQHVMNLLSLLAHNRRLLILPEIKALYEVHKSEQEKKLAVDVISYSQLSEEQLKHLSASLSKRFDRDVTLNVKIDPTIVGGAVICAGGMVIDGSVQGKLNKLKHSLTA